jgi:hypothetical protein
MADMEERRRRDDRGLFEPWKGCRLPSGFHAVLVAWTLAPALLAILGAALGNGVLGFKHVRLSELCLDIAFPGGVLLSYSFSAYLLRTQGEERWAALAVPHA